KSLDGPKPISEVLKDGFLADLLQTLANYKGEKVCYGNVCVAPEEIAPDGVTPKAGKKNPADRGALE
ncbi:TlpA family protein disulfide reductase, partial [Sinorhizobium meliloti]